MRGMEMEATSWCDRNCGGAAGGGGGIQRFTGAHGEDLRRQEDLTLTQLRSFFLSNLQNYLYILVFSVNLPPMVWSNEAVPSPAHFSPIIKLLAFHICLLPHLAHRIRHYLQRLRFHQQSHPFTTTTGPQEEPSMTMWPPLGTTSGAPLNTKAPWALTKTDSVLNHRGCGVEESVHGMT